MYDTKMMSGNLYITIDGKQAIATLQKEFTKTFPFLKIEFFREPCIKGKGNSKDKMIPTNEILNRLYSQKPFGKIAFTKQTTVSELEENFLNKFGICMQVFRKSGNIWLETTSTDDWTLEQQNEEGRSLAQHFKIERENPDDHDMY
jgi:hypothetical protein